MGRLVVVSNRTANLAKKNQAGGLTVGIIDALRSQGGLWMGWDGNVQDAVGDLRRSEHGNISILTTPLTNAEHEQYYLGFSNKVLWPAFHNRLDLMDYRTEFVDRYSAVNERFAKLLAPQLENDDVIWIHDYHLMPMAAELRKLGIDNRIGFFLHIPFPPVDVFSAVPRHPWLRYCLLQYDLVGFQTLNDVHNFHRYLEEHSDADIISPELVRVRERTVHIGHYPIGIDVKQFAQTSSKPDDAVELERMRRKVLRRFQLISADRLDYSKGLPHRIKAFRKFLDLYPEYQGHAEYLQIASPSREDVSAYGDIRAELEQLAGAVNGKFADFNWAPIQYINRSIPRTKLAPLFKSSLIGLITPLRDGMNLVAKEYVAAQDDSDPGILILSKFAGAAEELREAILVNPYNIQEVAEAIHKAATMPLEERQLRHRKLLRRVTDHDAQWWQRKYLNALLGHAEQQAQSSGRLAPAEAHPNV
ncbi:trehalose-6-phosphate synthase [Phyllobacterium sp. 21LDTY02-6]|jgi:trehalose 6-phosphate synthase|uniref:alpha,alpha-trehalose-phosphate synthase (UDP-forming) n=1 Tax=Phyllobacterium sp. 21LDTY02-6 TaxID=2944903 RepID=UPI00201FD54B|nr:trehalose-6-phosphate synthase [Phyllobacterium sp. 21LDTY02-6]MCO4316238.1 trehalose-6-phosphate synthase [Phyllobacterium sp. 21LDTY02-6]